MARLNIPKRELGGQQIQLGDVGGIGRAKEKLEEAGDFTRVVDSAMRLGAGIASMAGKAREEDQRKQLQILGTEVKADSMRRMTAFENRAFEIPEGERSQERFRSIAAEEANAEAAAYTKRIESLPEGKLKEELRAKLEADTALIQANYERAADTAYRSEAPREKARRDKENADLTRQELAVATSGGEAVSAQAAEDFQEALTKSSIEELADPKYLESLAEQYAGQEVAGLLGEGMNISDDEARNNYLEVLERGKEAIYSSYRTKAKDAAQAAREFIATEENNSKIDDALERGDYSSLSAMIGPDGIVATDTRIGVFRRPENARSVTSRVESEIARQLEDPINGAESALSFSALSEDERSRFSQRLQNRAADSLSKLANSAFRSISNVGSSSDGSGDLSEKTAIDRARTKEYRDRIRPLLEKLLDSPAVDDQARVDAESTLKMFDVLDRIDQESTLLALSRKEIVGSSPLEQMARQKVGVGLQANFDRLMAVLSDPSLDDNEKAFAVDQYAEFFAFGVEQLGGDQSQAVQILSSVSFDGPMGTELFVALDRKLPEVRNANARRQLVEGIKKHLNIEAMLQNLDPKDRALLRSAIAAATTFGEVTDILAMSRGKFVGISERLKSEALKIPGVTSEGKLRKQYETADSADLLLANVLKNRSSKGTVYSQGSHSVEVKKRLSLGDALDLVQTHPYLRAEFYAQAGMLGLDAIGTALENALDVEMPDLGNSAFSGSALAKNPPENYFALAGDLFSLELEMGSLSDLGIDMDQVAGAKLVSVDGESATYQILRKTANGSKAYIMDENGDILHWTVHPESSYSRLSHLKALKDQGLTEEKYAGISALEGRKIEDRLADVRSSDNVVRDYDPYEYAATDRHGAAYAEGFRRRNPDFTLPTTFARISVPLLEYLVGERSYGPTPDPTVLFEWPKNSGVNWRWRLPSSDSPQPSKLDYRLDQNHLSRGLERVMSETGIPEAEAQDLMARGMFAAKSFLEMQPKYTLTPGWGWSTRVRVNEPVSRDRALISTEDFQGAMFFLKVAEESARTLYELGLKMDDKPPGWDRLQRQRKALAEARAFAIEAYNRSVEDHMENVVMPMVSPMLEAIGGSFSPPISEGVVRPSQRNTEGNVRQYIRDRISETFLFEYEVSGQVTDPLIDSLAEAALTGNASGWNRVLREFLDKEIKGDADWKSEWQRESGRMAKEREGFFNRMSPEWSRGSSSQLEAGRRLAQQREELRAAQIVRENIQGFASGAIRSGISQEFWEVVGEIVQKAMIQKLDEQINEMYQGVEEGPVSPFSWQDNKIAPLADTNRITSIAMKEAVRVYRTQIETLGGSEDISLDVATEAFRDGIESALDNYFRENPIRRSYSDASGKFHRREFRGIELPWPPALRDVPTPDQEALLKFGHEHGVFINPPKFFGTVYSDRLTDGKSWPPRSPGRTQ